MKDTKFTRQELHDLVWQTPLTQLSKKFCISDNGLRKMCKAMNIPLPPNGYWQKIKYGKTVERSSLPKQNSGKEEVVLKPRTENCNELSTAMSAQGLKAKEIMSDEKLVLSVPDRLSSRPDPLITSTKKYRDAVKRHDWRHSSYPERIGVLNINVSDESLPRALRIMDTVIKTLRARNHGVEVDYDDTIAIISGERIPFRLREKNKVGEKTSQYGSREMIPTGDLMFCIGKYSWREKYINDGKQRLETKIAVIIAKLEIEGKAEHEERLEGERRRKIQEEQERIAKELKERKEAELKKFT